jgi:hypothetical protein
MSGGEKLKMGYSIASAGMDIATSGFSVVGAISGVEDAISIARTIRAAVVSHSISFALWEKSVNDQQQMLAGKALKSSPTQAVKNPDKTAGSKLRPGCAAPGGRNSTMSGADPNRSPTNASYSSGRAFVLTLP